MGPGTYRAPRRAVQFGALAGRWMAGDTTAMFIGHFAVGLAAKHWAPRVNLGYLMLAPLLLDLLWPLFVLAGMERFHLTPGDNPFLQLGFDNYPWSHSLLLALVWAYLFAAIYRHRGGTARGAWVLSIGVVSHWALDWVTHLPDMPLWPTGPVVGLGLWRSPPATVTLELLMLGVGSWLYLTATRAKDRIGMLGPGLFLALLVLLYVQALLLPSPAPGSERLIALTALIAAPLLLVLGWIDRHRKAVAADATE